MTLYGTHTRHARVGLNIAALVATVAGGQAIGAQGLTYDMRMTGTRESGGRTTPAQTVMTAHGQFSGGNSRMDIDQTMMPGGMMGKGTYIIVRSNSRTELIVDPEKRTYIEMNPDSMAKFASAAQGALGGMVKSEMTDVSADVQPLGPGETIQGYATMRYRLTTGYTMTTSIMGRTNHATVRSTTDMWIAPKLAGLFNPMARGAQPGGGTSAYADKVAEAYARIGKGVPIKTVTQSVTTGDHGSSSTSTMELLNIRTGAISPSVFEVPSDYTKTDITAGLGAATAGLDSLKRKMGNGNLLGNMADSAKQGAKEGATEEAKDQAKDKAKGVIRGLFGRPRE